MKSKFITILAILLNVTACDTHNNNSTNSSIENDYATVKFDLNYDVEDDTYLNLIVFSNQELKEPEEPNRKDYVFEGWYLDEECKEAFEGFNKEVTDDLTLYASWSPYEELKDNEKIDRFIEKIKKYSGKVGTTTIESEGLERYYTPIDYSFPFYQVVEYNRYADITTADYYDENQNKYASQQYFYDDNYFYSIFNDIEEEGLNNEKQTAPFNENKIESHLNIDFLSLFGSLLTSLSKQIKDGYSADEMSYEFTLNDTYLDPYQVNYAFTLNYYTYNESEDLGAVEEVYMMEFGLTFVNGMIKRSKVVQQYMLGIQGEVQYVIEDNIYATYEIVDEYQVYTGERFNPNDY